MTTSPGTPDSGDPRPGPHTGTSLILGTAGHIDHGKTSLVRALTGVDTDRLDEEKRRGITIELGFARYTPQDGTSFGIVDVPGHEGFVRTMVAGATGMDIVLLVVAADEGVMPQTREHLAIIRLLGVEGMVVAITKADLVDEEWLELVDEDVRGLLAGTPYENVDIVPTSVHTGDGLAELSRALLRCGRQARERVTEDLARLPVDRVFAMEGAGTVVTGTLWSGRLVRGSTVRILPRDDQARIRAIQVHGVQEESAVAGQRTALALTGVAVRRGVIARGDVLVSDDSWSPSMMLTVELRALEESGWRLEAGQRVRVHLGTVEVMARVALFGVEEVVPHESALAQLRLEGPVVARSGDRFVVRSYSPVTTIAGGVVLEPIPPKRKRLSDDERLALAAMSRSGIHAVRGAAALAGWMGLEAAAAGVRAGWRTGIPDDADSLLWRLDGVLFDPAIASAGEDLLLAAVRRHHADHHLDSGAPLGVLRTALPPPRIPAWRTVWRHAWSSRGEWSSRARWHGSRASKRRCPHRRRGWRHASPGSCVMRICRAPRQPSSRPWPPTLPESMPFWGFSQAGGGSGSSVTRTGSARRHWTGPPAGSCRNLGAGKGWARPTSARSSPSRANT